MKEKFVKPAVLLSILIVVFSIVAFNACSKSSSGYGNGGNNGGTGSGNSVSIKNFAFSVSSLSIKAGTTVTWTNNDATAHTVTADDGSFDSDVIQPGATFSHKFSAAGTVNYHCTIHTSMTAAIVVGN